MWIAIVTLHIFLLLLCFRLTIQIACKDEKGKDVDWYIAYKLPKIETEPSRSNLADGKGYAYITNSDSSWELSSKSITSDSILEKTLDDLYSNKKKLTYLFYNDDVPEGFTGTSVGHLKGVLAFDKKSGFWMIHSIPKFADTKHYKYPDNSLINGQSILCVTFSTSELNEICNQLLYSHPNIYESRITDEVNSQLEEEAQTLFKNKPSFITTPRAREIALESLGKEIFQSFAKVNKYKDDLYSGIIAPGLKSSLITETWRRGSGRLLSPSCKSDYSVLDIVSINMTVTNKRKSKSISFKSTEDHSKWAISDDKNKNWICIADLNRMVSQAKRGGGALCFESENIINAYNSIIAETRQCPIKNKKSKKKVGKFKFFRQSSPAFQFEECKFMC